MEFLFSNTQLPSGAHDLATGDDAEAVARVIRLAMGTATPADYAHVSRAAKTWLSSNGDVPFERSLRLPTTPDSFRRMQRDRWLCKAAKRIPAAGSWNGAEALLLEWDRFLSRGPWRDWRDESDPPEWAEPLSRALFYASSFNRGQSLGLRQIWRIARHVFESKSQ